jgi:ectoine hydroxylase-related dioxygenase (phytanoyl-CoA dioxygenase family)
MGQQELKDIFFSQGYIIFRDLIDPSLIYSLDRRQAELIPQRGHGVDNKYFNQNVIETCPELALWWSQQLTHWVQVQQISNLLINTLGDLFDDPCVYVADIISNTPKNKYIKPHIDSPYRFKEWHASEELLGLQCILPLCEFTKFNGGTGILPGSHRKTWIVADSYKGLYNDIFLKDMIQPSIGPGDVLVYHPKLLHSTMPNITNQNRRALLIHITSQTMAAKMRQVDNIFTGLPSLSTV